MRQDSEESFHLLPVLIFLCTWQMSLPSTDRTLTYWRSWKAMKPYLHTGVLSFISAAENGPRTPAKRYIRFRRHHHYCLRHGWCGLRMKYTYLHLLLMSVTSRERFILATTSRWFIYTPKLRWPTTPNYYNDPIALSTTSRSWSWVNWTPPSGFSAM